MSGLRADISDRGKKMLVLCWGILLGACFLTGSACANTILVPSNYAKIQNAVNAAASGDVIEVSPGEYSGSVTMKSGITLRGLNRQNTVINATGTGKRAITIPWQSSNVSISGFTIKGGIAEGTGPNDPYGGGIFVDGSSGITISDCTITSNSSIHGGGVAMRNSSVVLRDNFISGNSAQSVGGGSCQVSGGGIFAWSASVYNNQITVSGNQIVNNRSQVPVPPPGNPQNCYALGGGMFHQLDTPTASHSLTVSNNNFSSNQTNGAQHYGGGLYLYMSRNSQAQVTNNTFSGNNGLDGGGIALIESNAAVVNNRFFNNAARWGGGLYGWHMSSRIEGNTFNRNRVTDALCDAAYPACSGGGGVLFDVATGDSTHTFRNNLVVGNSSESWGGGVDLYASTYEVSRNKIIKNTGDWGGGVLVNTAAGGASNPNVYNNLITDNTALDWGGGVGIGGAAEQTGQIRNNLIARNQAGNTGGGIVVYYLSSPGIINNTIYNNTKGGIRVDSSVPVIMNNTITSHRDSYGISVVGAAITPVYNDVWDSLAGHSYEGVTAGAGSISADPKFVNTATNMVNDFHLQSGSPCIDTGNPDQSYLDLDGSRADMGMYGGPKMLPLVFPDKVGIFRSGAWFLDMSGNSAWNGCSSDRCYSFGMAGDTPVIGDWNGDGTMKIGIFRDGGWFLDYNGNGVWNGCGTTPDTDRCLSFGTSGDIPVVGDWDGTGKSKIGAFRDGGWFLDYGGNGVWDGCGTTPDTDRCLSFGTSGDIPVVGDWDGSVLSKIGVFRDGGWFLDYGGNGVWDGCGTTPDTDRCSSFGMAGDIPVTADWDWSGYQKIGVFRSGSWFVDYNGGGTWEGCATDQCYYGFGMSGDSPVAGRWQ